MARAGVQHQSSPPPQTHLLHCCSVHAHKPKVVSKEGKERNDEAEAEKEDDGAEGSGLQRLAKALSSSKSTSRQRIVQRSGEVVDVENGKGSGQKAGQDGGYEKGKKGKVVSTSDAGVEKGAMVV